MAVIVTRLSSLTSDGNDYHHPSVFSQDAGNYQHHRLAPHQALATITTLQALSLRSAGRRHPTRLPSPRRWKPDHRTILHSMALETLSHTLGFKRWGQLSRTLIFSWALATITCITTLHRTHRSNHITALHWGRWGQSLRAPIYSPTLATAITRRPPSRRWQ